MAVKIGFKFLILILVSPVISWGAPLRIVSLSPALTQMCFEVLPAENRHWVVGVSEHAPMPPGATAPSVAAAKFIDYEKILSLRPTHVLFEKSATSQSSDTSKKVGHWAEFEFKRLTDIGAQYRRIGILLGHPEVGEKLALKFHKGLEELKSASTRTGVVNQRVFFQIDENPMIAVGGGQDFLPELIVWMGIKNVFSSLSQSYPRISEESVLAARPDVIVVIGLRAERQRFEAMAKKWKGRSTRIIDGDLLTLPGLSMVQGGKQLLQVLSGPSSTP